TETSPFWKDYAQPGQLALNDGRGRFREAPEEAGLLAARADVGRGLAFGDVDGDGTPDLLVTTCGGPARLFRSSCPSRGHWLIVKAFDPERSREAVGALVILEAGGR